MLTTKRDTIGWTQATGGTSAEFSSESSELSKSKFAGVSEAGVACIIKSWRNLRNELQTSIGRSFCRAFWDGLNCWRAAVPNETVEIPCSEILRKYPQFHENIGSITGSAFTSCSRDGTWIGGPSGNYSSCTLQIRKLLLEQQSAPESTSIIRAFIPYVLLSGSILSIVCLVGAISVYIYLKSMYLDRLKILLQMMIALLLKSLIWIIVVGPIASPLAFDYRALSWTCRLVISMHFYSLLVATFWMLMLGYYLNEKLNAEHLQCNVPMDRYAIFSWAVPILIVSLWATVMVLTTDSVFWIDYKESKAFWIIAIPLLAAPLTNLVYLFNIFQGVAGRLPFAQSPSQFNQIRKAKRDIVILCPLLGVNNLLFLYNPGGDAEQYYMLFHALFQSVQGGIVAVLCCFVSANVYRALWKKLNRSYCSSRGQGQVVARTTKCIARGNAVEQQRNQNVVGLVHLPD